MCVFNVLMESVCLVAEKAMAPTPVLLPGKSMDGGAWWAAVHGVAKSQTLLSDFTFTFHFHALERKWQPTPVFLPGESQGRGSLVGCRLWGRTESDRTEATQQQHSSMCLVGFLPHLVAQMVKNLPAV